MELDAKALNENLLPGPWWVQEGENTWKLFALHPQDPHLHPVQIVKAPKQSIEYACYWPAGINEKIIAAAPLLYEAALAGREYDRAIRKCANDPEKMASFCTAKGEDLDDLYMDWMTKIQAAMTHIEFHTRLDYSMEAYRKIQEALTKK